MKPSLFIGLGGTGARSLLELKKRFVEQNTGPAVGQPPEATSFLVIDADEADPWSVSQKAMVEGSEVDVSFHPGEVIGLSAPNAKDMIFANPDHFPWIEPSCRELSALDDLSTGAGQVRLFGRIGFAFNSTTIRQRLRHMVVEARNVERSFSDLHDDGIEVHIIGSLAGGAASGCFQDMALLLRDVIRLDFGGAVDCRIIGHFLMPHVFVEELGEGFMPRALANGRAALRELDMFHSVFQQPDHSLRERWSSALSEGSPEAWTMRYVKESIEVHSAPFDRVFLTDSLNTAGRTATHRQDLIEAMARGAFQMATPSAMQAALIDNLNGDIQPSSEEGGSWGNSFGYAALRFDVAQYREFVVLKGLDLRLTELLVDEEVPSDHSQEIAGLGLEALADLGSPQLEGLKSRSPLPAIELVDDVDPAMWRARALAQWKKSIEGVSAGQDAMLSAILADFDSFLEPDSTPGFTLRRFKMRELERALRDTIEKSRGLQDNLKLRIHEVEMGLFAHSDSLEATLDELDAGNWIERLLSRSMKDDLQDHWSAGMKSLFSLLLDLECLRVASFVQFDALQWVLDVRHFDQDHQERMRTVASHVKDSLSHLQPQEEPSALDHWMALPIHWSPEGSSEPWKWVEFVDEVNRQWQNLEVEGWEAFVEWLKKEGHGVLALPDVSEVMDSPEEDIVERWSRQMNSVEETEDASSIVSTVEEIKRLVMRSAPWVAVESWVSEGGGGPSRNRRLAVMEVPGATFSSLSIWLRGELEELMQECDRHGLNLVFGASERTEPCISVSHFLFDFPVRTLVRSEALQQAYDEAVQGGACPHVNDVWKRAMDSFGADGH